MSVITRSKTRGQPTDSGLPTDSELPSVSAVGLPITHGNPPDTPASPRASAVANPEPRFERDDRSRHSSRRSVRSTTSIAARKRAIELRYAQEKAKIHEALLDKQMQAELAAVDAGSDIEEEDRGDTVIAPQERVTQWLNESTAPPPPARLPERAITEPQPVVIQHPPPMNTYAATSWRSKMLDLPTFDGSNYMDWLAFRAAYRQTSEMSQLSKIENMARLRVALKGKAKETVAALLHMGTDPEQVINNLNLRYDRPDLILRQQTTAIRSAPSHDIFELAAQLNNSVQTLAAINESGYLYSPELLAVAYDKLSPTLKHRWAEHAFTIGKQRANLSEMARFLMKEAHIARAVPTFTEQTTSRGPKPQDQTNPRSKPPLRRAAVHATEATDGCQLCSERHTLPDCNQFKAMSIASRWRLVKKHHLCFRCCASTHRRDECNIKNCGIDGCDRAHHKLLHDASLLRKTQPTPNTDDNSASFSCCAATEKKTYLKVIPVTIYGPKGEAKILAMLDEGSTITMLEEKVAASIGAEGPTSQISINTIDGSSSSQSKKVSVKISGPNEKMYALHNVRTLSELRLTPQSITRADVERYRHLRGLPQDIHYEAASPKMLIGQDQWHLIVSRELRCGRKNEPVASHTSLGWVLHGCTSKGRDQAAASYAVFQATITDPLAEEVRKHFTLESVGVVPRHIESKETERARELLREAITHEEGRYCAPLLWANDEHSLPNNHTAAFNRLKTIERKMDRHAEYKKTYTHHIDEMIRKGYAEKRDIDPNCRHTWHLPHFSVTNPNKPGKLRIVHDAAARTNGVCLNDMLLSGPDELQSLPGILFRFREERVALTGDIREMFPQIKIRESDQEAQRFLWRGDRRHGPPDSYVMTSMVFGAASSPFTALYVKNHNAELHATTHPEAAVVIQRDHYMDDCLTSTATTEEAIQLAADISYVHAQAGFEIRDWASNDERVLRAIPEDKRHHKGVTLATDDPASLKTLGLLWDPAHDTLRFAVTLHRVPPEVIDGQRTPTKREVLSVLMSLYDPQGFAAPYVVRGRILLQQIWRSGIDWDEQLRRPEANEWSKWFDDLESLKQIHIPRWYRDRDDEHTTELHIFVDASALAFCAVAYWRYCYNDGSTHITLVGSKARVAPLKPVSIPRLELQAAILGARFAAAIAKAHRRPINRRVFWSDSKTALSWIRSDARNYKPFVAHRVADITDLTDSSEWRWVPTKINVADDATRGSYGEFNSHHRWYTGPEFLRQPPQYWPGGDPIAPNTEEEKKSTVCATAIETTKNRLLDIDRFSCYNKLRRTTARVVLFTELLRRQSRPANEQGGAGLQRRHMDTAQRLLLRQAQLDTYSEEYKCLRDGKPISKRSPLYRLDTRLGTDDLIRLNGRTRRATESNDQLSQPVVLDGRHPIVRLLIRAYHIRYQHANTETVVNELRQRFHILRLRPAARTIARDCQHCKIRRAMPTTPPMGDLPAERLGSRLRPFTNCGLDYMGPIEVSIGRRREKRYVALFTCLTVRAVHLELVYSLTTDSAIMAVRRFIARRGRPAVLLSDNATCFRGASTELHTARAELQPDRLAEFALENDFEWRFIPPASPFMGGAWERLVRSIKTSLRASLNERAPREEILVTALAEAENIVNARPLTHVAVEADDPEALTPNHFLLGSSSGAPTPGVFDDTDLLPRRAWRTSQRLADMFWQRWVREYLPTLTPRPTTAPGPRDLQPGDVVFVVDPNLPRNTWIRGLVTRIYPGEDGRVRVADVRTRGGSLRRPTRRLARIPTEAEAPTPAAETSSPTRQAVR